MHLALALYRYMPFGGLERNALAVAEAAARRGARVTVFTRSWSGARLAGIEVVELAVRARTNVGRDREFARALASALRERRFDALVAFNRLPAADVFYAADPCFAATRGRGARALVPQRRQRLAWERALAAPENASEILVLTADQAQRYRQHYGTPAARLHVLPPGVRDEFLAAGPTSAPELRAELGIPAAALVVLALGSDFARKGLDRTVAALGELPRALRERVWLVAVGAARAGRFQRAARALAPRVRFVGGREDVLSFYRAADVFVHPAREENTGTVLLEALSQGVPVIAAGACGFAEHVRAADAGVVLGEPFAQRELDGALAALLDDDARRAQLGARGRSAAQRWRMHARTAAALDVIERAAKRKRASVCGTAAEAR
ncbi:MAG: glycosyltransferase [Planctomycetes bacterium]|nr:glycosyltransferase [Planctomycetota bacterium]